MMRILWALIFLSASASAAETCRYDLHRARSRQIDDLYKATSALFADAHFDEKNLKLSSDAWLPSPDDAMESAVGEFADDPGNSTKRERAKRVVGSILGALRAEVSEADSPAFKGLLENLDTLADYLATCVASAKSAD